MAEVRKSTSLKIKPSLRKKVKLYAVKHDMQLSDIFEEALSEWLKKKSVQHD